MAVADLDEGEPVARRRSECFAQSQSARNPARDRPDDAGTGPGHAFEKPAPAEVRSLGFHSLVVLVHSSLHRQACRCDGDRPGWLFIRRPAKKLGQSCLMAPAAATGTSGATTSAAPAGKKYSSDAE